MTPEIQFSSSREAPAEVVRGLREIDPRAVVLWWGPTQDVEEVPDPRKPWVNRIVSTIRPMWLVGVWDPYRQGNATAAKRMERYDAANLHPGEYEQPEEFRKRCHAFRQRRRLAQLSYQGFDAKFFWQARDLDASLVHEFYEMAWFAHHLFEQLQRQQIAELDKPEEDLPLTERQALMLKLVRDAMPDIWRHTMRGRRSVLVPSHAA